jgi:RNA polymerase sigma factor (sigma-70 family)
MTPEEHAATHELRWCVRVALAGLPDEWRRALLLRHADGLAVGEVAKTLGRSEQETRHILERARDYLRQRLLESGCRFAAA